jgi:hypothetical protein
VKDLQVKGDGIYAPQRKKEEKHSPTQLAIQSLKQKLLVEDVVPKESQEVFQLNQGINLDNIINLDDF